MRRKIKEIKKEIVFAFYAIKKNMESSAELRSSFLINVFGMMLNNSAFLVVWMFFGTVAGGIGGWKPIDMLGMLGFGTLGYGICFSFFRGISNLPEMVNEGNFDKFLLSPKNVLLRVSVSSFSPSAVGDLFFGILSLVVWFYFTTFSFTAFIFTIIFAVCCALIFFFFSVFVNSAAFYFIDSRTIVQGFFEFLMTPSIFYGGAIQGLMRFVFIFIIPALLLGTLPVEAIKQLSYLKLFLVIVLTVFWGFFSVWIFNKAIKKYESTNFITFG